MNISNITSQNLNNVQNLQNNPQQEVKASSTPIEEEVITFDDSFDQNDEEIKPEVHKKWTVLHYGAGDNDVGDYIKQGVQRMERVGSSDSAHVVSMLDLPKQNCVTYYVTKNHHFGINSPVVKENGCNVNMADPDTLAQFIAWGIKKYPSDHVAVILNSHGGGSKGAIVEEYGHGFGDMMTPQELREAFSKAEEITGKKVYVLGFDACLMANMESVYELKDAADYIVASEETEIAGRRYGLELPGLKDKEIKIAGLWPYAQVLRGLEPSFFDKLLNGKTDVTPEEFAKHIVKVASKHQKDLQTMSAIDTSKIGKVAGAVDEFAKSILEATKDLDNVGILNKIKDSTKSFENSSKDIYHFCELIANSEELQDESLKTEAKKVMSAIDEAVIAHQSEQEYYGNTHGLQMEIPKYNLGKDYVDLQFAKDTHWDEAVESMDTINIFQKLKAKIPEAELV
ncbi:hypothetical protein IJJ97_01495 [bacterium]|nr:hypothetical protein [bacterium]